MVPEYINTSPRDISAQLKIINSNVNETELSDAELADRLKAYTDVGFIPKSINNDGIYNRTLSLLRERLPEISARFGDGRLQDDARKVSNTIISGGDIGGLPQYLRQSAEIVRNELPKFTTNERNFSEDIKRIQNLINERNKKAQSEKQVEDYLTSLPEELATQREQFLQGETQRGVDRFREDISPQILASANARGALFSGDVPDLLTMGALDIQSTLDDARATLEAEDNKFYFNAAYSNAIRKALESNVNLTNFISGERQGILTDQSNRFQREQSSIDRALQDQLYRAQAERSLRLQETNLRNQQNKDRQAASKQQAQQIGGLVGTVAGTVIGGPVGGAVGSQIGSSIG